LKLTLVVRRNYFTSMWRHHLTFTVNVNKLTFAENPIVIYYEVVNMRDKTRSQT